MAGSRKLLAILFLCIATASCSDSGPGTGDFEDAIRNSFVEQRDRVVRLSGEQVANTLVPKAEDIEFVAVENIRKADDATFVADVTVKHKVSGQSQTSSASIRHIGGEWQVVEDQ